MKVKDYFKQLFIVHAAICFGMLVILLIFQYVLPKTTDIPNIMFAYVGAGLGIISVLASRILFMSICAGAKSENNIGLKMAVYRKAFILQLAIIEFGAITNAIILYLNGHEINFAFSLALLFLMIMRRPSKANTYEMVFDIKTRNNILDNDENEIG